MSQSDAENLILVSDSRSVDNINREFYGRFPYPSPPRTYPKLEDSDFETVMLNQSLGNFSHPNVPSDAKVWVAGCGTNQAIYTALRFPKADVVGSDISASSLAACHKQSRNLGTKNLTLRQESLNEVTYRDEFNYILCTGVIHHNADPARNLGNISRALHPDGVLELMVYNRFHRTFTTAFQKAVRTICRYGGATWSWDQEVRAARVIAAAESLPFARHAKSLSDMEESEIADLLIQPVEYSYTVESLNALAAQCGLELVLPCYDQFDHNSGHMWTIEFSADDVRARFEALPDVVRWQIANLLLLENSPMLWFYLKRASGSRDERYEARVNQAFLTTRFTRSATQLRNYVREAQNLSYRISPSSVPYPMRSQNNLVREIVQRVDGKRVMQDILTELGMNIARHKAVTDIRVQTTTPMCPYLRAL